MNVLIDTNIAIDVLLQRRPFLEHSQLVFLASEHGLINGFVSAAAVTDIFYIVKKHMKNRIDVRGLLKKHLIGTVRIAAVDEYAISKALDMDWDDFEDCVQYVVGENIPADYIVTRNPADFKSEGAVVVTPEELLDIISPN